jgi:uncharacterized membrane protein
MPDRFPFRYRAHEVSRIEAFSDIVFGFALTLIVVSLEVPKTFKELMEAMKGFPAFALCFAILLWIWHAHYTFYRRYAIHDEFTLVINSTLLFVVLFYVYPLKFIFSGLFELRSYAAHDARVMFSIYGLGFTSIFFLYAMLYRHALKKRDELQLNAVELIDTRTHVFMFAANVGIGLLSVTLAWTLPDQLVGVAGFIYFLIGIMAGTIGTIMGNRRRRIEEQMINNSQASPGNGGAPAPSPASAAGGGGAT